MSFSKCPERTYAEGSKLSCVEDSTHEFKGHRNLAVEELPKWCFVPGSLRRSRKAVSRCVACGVGTTQNEILVVRLARLARAVFVNRLSMKWQDAECVPELQ